MNIQMTDIAPGFARILLDGESIGIVEKVEHVGRAIHQGDSDGSPVSDNRRDGTFEEVVSRELWAFTPRHMENAAITLNNGPRDLAGGHATRKDAIEALVEDHLRA